MAPTILSVGPRQIPIIEEKQVKQFKTKIKYLKKGVVGADVAVGGACRHVGETLKVNDKLTVEMTNGRVPHWQPIPFTTTQ